MPRLDATEPPPAPRGRRRIDLAIGIGIGVALGIVVICAFLFLGSEGSIDAPRISGVDTGKPAQRAAQATTGQKAGASTPTPSSPPLLEAGFENGLAGWSTAGVGEVAPTVVSQPVRAGAHSARFALTGTQGRSELILGGDGGTGGMKQISEGAEYWYGFSFNVQQMVYGHPGAHNIFMQLKSEGEGSPNFALQLWDYAGSDGGGGGRGLWSSGEAMGGNRFLAPVAEQKWHDVAIHFKASSQGAGFYQVYLDGQLVDSRNNVSMIVPGHSYAYIKNGLYRNGATNPGTSEIFLDAAKLGTSKTSVQPG